MNGRAGTKYTGAYYSKKSRSYASWRFWMVYGLIIVFLVILATKLAYLQVIEPESLIKQADIRTIRKQALEAPRGLITDRSGRVLAVSVPVEAIWIDPKKILESGGISETDERWLALANALVLPLSDLIARINKNAKSRFIYVGRQVTETAANYIRDLKLPYVGFEKESRRYYPTGEASAQLIGFTDIDGKGIEGIERSFDEWLTGKSGEKTVRRDRHGRVIENIASVSKEDAQTIRLSIDERLQTIVYRELSNAVAFNKAESGSAVLVDIQTGEVLAMVNSPSFNPNNRTNIIPSSIRNRALTDAFEPGSTVKPLVVMAALNNHIVTPSTVIDTKPFSVNKHMIRDVSYSNNLTLKGVLQKSSNVGVSRLALQMEPKQLAELYAEFGFGKPTKIGLIGESTGLNPLNRKHWSDIERATYAFGYGVMATPLQLARVYATMGSFGISRPLSILRLGKAPTGKRVFSEKIAREVVTLMESVAQPGGGGVRAAVNGYRVAVKTGTAKKVGSSGKYIDEYIAYTAGIAPASKPRYSLVVVINDPKAGKYYGGTVSAPVFSNIMGSVLRTMNIEPDALPENSIVINRKD